ncbi:hypothetical protein [Actinoplanes sp. NPDC020271]|uniref:hypothetical protein n=1 Tax=Actinoplanes sp. NPDC020271 TaxID=3363896 RepID=UPI00378752C6
MAVPEKVLEWGGRGTPTATAVAVARVLGVRQIVQAVVTSARPSPQVAGLSAMVDAAHASTGVWLAATSPRWRPIATADAAFACGLAVVGWLARRRAM